MFEHTHQWLQDGYALYYRENYSTRKASSKIMYVFYYQGKIIFQGTEFELSPLHKVGSKECTNHLLSFISLKPGDTDEDWFNSYTSEQLEFVTKHGEELSILAHDLLNGGDIK
jgi:hypothetical protein